MIKTIVFAAAIAFTSVCQASLNDCLKATVHIIGSRTQGTGVIFKESDQFLFFLTAGHVVQDDMEVVVKLYNSGHESHKIRAFIGARILKSTQTGAPTTNDLACGVFLKEDLQSYPAPKVIPLADINYKAKAGDVATTCGHAKGLWSTGYIGQIEVADDGDKFILRPHVLPGRSGSGVFDEDGKVIIGVAIWQDGGCVPASKILKFLNEKGLQHLTTPGTTAIIEPVTDVGDVPGPEEAPVAPILKLEDLK